MSSETVKTRLLIISDTHTTPPKSDNEAIPGPPQGSNIVQPVSVKYAYREPLPSADVLLHAGDITMSGQMQEYRKMLNVLKNAKAELKLVIAGNHDITLDPEYYERYGKLRNPRSGPVDLGLVREMWTGEDARSHGIVYLEHGVRTFTLKSRARFTIYASPYQPEFCQWAFAYERNEDIYNPSPPVSKKPATHPVPSHPQIDLMMTHGPPYKRLDRTSGGQDVGCEHLLRAVERCRPRLHCFGHIHEGWGAELVKWAPKDDTQKPSSIGKGLRKKIETIEKLDVDMEKAWEDRAVMVDFSHESGKGLTFGDETLFVNASIMDVRYSPVHAPWLVDLDLPKAKETGLLDV
ncbi:MAG: hypothetical protein M1837_002564 [Sclerophora amabilis]|nr:MAG: hypothetical protein M1837_002564 [Sclerophora amabilis]